MTDNKSINQQQVDKVLHWQTNPCDWIVDWFGDNIKKASGLDTYTGLTLQQEHAAKEMGKIVEAKLKAWHPDPNKREEHFKAQSPEVQKYAAKIGLSIMSGQGTGKDFFAAIMLLWFMVVFYMAKCLATANTAKQLRNVYWAEISKLMRLAKQIDPEDPRSPTVLEKEIEYQSEKIFMKEFKGREWFCEAVTINAKSTEEEQAAALAGRHEDHMLFVVDEASGIPDPVFRPLEGTLTGKINLVLLIFNPTRPRGFAINSQSDDRFISLRWNSEDSEMVSKTHIKNMEDKYGRDSNTFRIRVLGLPPTAGSHSLIQFDWIMDAVDREFEEDEVQALIQGGDVGGGGDKSVSAIRHGGTVLPLARFNDKDTMEVARWLGSRADAFEVTASIIDMIGIGRGVYDKMRELRYKVYPGDSRARSKRPERFKNKRAEGYWYMREAFEQGTISIPDDEGLINALGAIGYDDETGVIQIWKKSKIRQELEGESPDESDAVALTYYYPETMFKKVRRSDKEDEDEDEYNSSNRSWMSG